MKCIQCGKTAGEGMSFCPYCGAKLPEPETESGNRNPEADAWVRKAMAVTSFPERKRILEQGLAACPDSREIKWEMLFIGTPAPKKRGFSLDFSIIKSWNLEIYRSPGEFSEAQRREMRSRLFGDPELEACFALFEDPARKQEEYIQRLCREYADIFLEGSNQVMGRLFGFQLDRNREKKLAQPVAEVIRRMREDKELSPEQREQLWKAMYQAYAGKTAGKTEYLDALL